MRRWMRKSARSTRPRGAVNSISSAGLCSEKRSSAAQMRLRFRSLFHAMQFIHDDFLLTTPAARRLYHECAAPEPIFDYHCHLSPKDIAENRQFWNLFEIWLEGDHYKWRAMRANGESERFVTGNATPEEKFRAWARTVPHTLRNPLYHWTHLELLRYFGISELLNEDNAGRVWARANDLLAQPEFSAQGLMKKLRVTHVCTTDDPTDDLRYHQAVAQSGL